MYIEKNVHWETRIRKTVLQSSLRPQQNLRGVGSRADNERQRCLPASHDPTLVVDLEAGEVPINGVYNENRNPTKSTETEKISNLFKQWTWMYRFPRGGTLLVTQTKVLYPGQ